MNRWTADGEQLIGGELKMRGSTIAAAAVRLLVFLVAVATIGLVVFRARDLDTGATLANHHSHSEARRSSSSDWDSAGSKISNNGNWMSDGSPHDLNWTIFITPQDFLDHAELSQRRAILSWQRLIPAPQIILMGQGKRYQEVADELGLLIDTGLDMNLVKMPLAGSLLDKATNYDTDVSVILNSDIILTQSFVDAIMLLQRNFRDWFLTGARVDIDALPMNTDPVHPESFSEDAFVQHARKNGVLHSAGGVDYFVWNNRRNGQRIPLINGHMPPFIRGKSKFDNWIVHETIHAGLRDTVDGTESITAVHLNHNYKQQGQGGAVVKSSDLKAGSTFWMSNKANDWQMYLNNHLALNYGTYKNQDGTSVHTGNKLSTCFNENRNFQCLIRRVRPAICPCEHHAFSRKTQSDPQSLQATVDGKTTTIVKCGAVSSDKKTYEIPTSSKAKANPIYGLPFKMADLLPIVASDNRVILTGVSYNYRDVLMNFVCNLRRLGIYDRLIIAAWDVDMFKFGFKMGLPIFLYESEIGLRGDMSYGSPNFRRVTKLKSKVVLEILKMGYEVTWTDSDIVWFQDPGPILDAMDSDFVVQSNAPSTEAKPNGKLRINSGFYRVRSTPVTVAAMSDIVEHASNSTLTEQPSFYIVLCGGSGGNTKMGNNACIYTASHVGTDEEQSKNLVVHFLDRGLYPNGATNSTTYPDKLMWDSPGLAENSEKLVILHNNWIKGVDNKVVRMIDRGFWHYHREKEICNYDTKPLRFLNASWIHALEQGEE